MNPTTFRAAAEAATASVPFDGDRLLAGVYRKRAHRTRRRRAAAALPVAAALAVGAVTVPSVLEPDTAPTAVASWEFAQVPAGSEPLATVAGVNLHYLPEGSSAEVSSVEEYVPLDVYNEAVPMVATDARWNGPQELFVGVTKGAGLTVDSYLLIHWFGGQEETTVNGRPALVNSVDVDGASGLLFSPEDGIVIEMHLAGGDGEELRRIVENMSLETPR